MRHYPIISLTIACVLAGCGTHGKLGTLTRTTPAVTLGLPYDDVSAVWDKGGVERDTLEIREAPQDEVLIMKAVKDEEGEMVATDVISAAMVSARFRNVAERHGKVDLRFLVTVPSSMLDSRWQLRLTPAMNVLGEDIELEPVLITGKDYRKAQLRGYQQYERFIRSIITDTTYVSDERFASIYGVTQREAVEHYTRMLAAAFNRRKIERKDRMFERYVKVPIVTEGLRLDTVMVSSSGDFIYEYVQTVNTAPALRKVDVRLSGSIYEEDRDLYSIPAADPLTFYISSLSTLTLDEERYLTQVIGRRVTANSTYWIDFGKNSHSYAENQVYPSRQAIIDIINNGGKQ